VYSLLVAVTLLSLVTIPVTWSILHRVFAAETESLVLPRDVAKITVRMLLVPLGLGIAIRQWIPSVADRPAKPLADAVNAFIGLVALLILVKSFPNILGLGAKALATMAVLTPAALAGGHLLGGPVVPEDRTALAVASSLRPLASRC
jgi:BASS family bile acid:Na+ symporter